MKVTTAACATLLGLGLGCSGLEAALGNEPNADVAHPLTLQRSGVTVQYPGNWTVGALDGTAPENAFTLESPGGCLVMVLLFDAALDPDELHATQLAEFQKLVTRAQSESFDTWGGMDGRGTRLRGNVLGLLPGEVRLFAASPREDRSLVVVEQCYDENTGARPGIEQVERTFSLQ